MIRQRLIDIEVKTYCIIISELWYINRFSFAERKHSFTGVAKYAETFGREVLLEVLEAEVSFSFQVLFVAEGVIEVFFDYQENSGDPEL